MDKSIFIDKNQIPDDHQLEESIGNTYPLWLGIREYVHLKYPLALDEWTFGGEKYGWSFRIKDKKRAILYLLPRDKYFKVAFVFGQKATDMILSSQVSELIKIELASAKIYAEGRGIRIDMKDASLIKDIQKLIEVKLAH